VTAFDLTGRTALVTGAGRGVGAGIARSLAEAGATVVVNDLHPERAEAVARELPDAVPLAFDVTDDDAIASGLARLGGIDVLVHNAGVLDGGGRPGRVVDLPADSWQLQLDLNLTALLRLTQAVLPHQLEQGWGRIIQISSGAASRGLAIGVSAYGAAKAGGESLIRHLAVECGPQHVTANALALGMMEGLPRESEPSVQRMIRQVPIGRLGLAAEVGAAVVWLASDAGALVNGQVIHLNGGSVFGR
jgi:3-oxoacyl-[acyl-carrier protein] reductase